MNNNIFVVNLKRCKKKRDRMKNRLKDYNFTLSEGVDGKKLSLEKMKEMRVGILKEWNDPYSGRNLTWGEVGCGLSHCNIYKECLNKNIKTAIVLEDDVEIVENFKDKINETLKNLKTLEWDLCYIGRKPMRYENESKVNEYFLKADYSYWTCGYIINENGMKKIINSGYLEKLIPIDEIIPLLGGVSPYENYKKNYNINEKLKILSVKDLFVKPENEAFKESDTENTEEVEIYTDDLLVLATGTDMTDGLERFIKSCKVYGLKHEIMGLGRKWKGGNMAKGPGGGQKINLLKETIEKIDDEKILLVTDSYDVIMTANSKEILEKYRKINSTLVFASESACWPDKERAKMYPKIKNRKNIYLNSGGFMGPAKAIKYILRDIPDYEDDQRYYTTVFFSEFGKKHIKLDYNCEIFQCLNNAEEEIIVNKSKSRIFNNITKTEPCQIHGNGPLNRKLYLNKLENYLMKNWTETWGYNKKNILDKSNLKDNICIYLHIEELSININNMEEMIKKNLDELRKISPNMRYIRDTKKMNRNEMLNRVLDLGEIDYVWIINTKFILTNKNTLVNLIIQNKGIISPLLVKKDLFSNFWGNVDKNGWYKDSDDYINIASKRCKGCWNVPHIAGNILINKKVLKQVKKYYVNNVNQYFDDDMIFNYNCRKNNLFLYLENTEEYGYLTDGVKDEIPKNAVHKEFYLFETDKKAWEKKYLHPDFLKIIDNWEKLEFTEPCKWVFEFPFVNELFCEHLIDEVNNINAWSPGGNTEVKDKRINNVENVPTVDIHMSQIKFRKQWEKIIFTYISHVVSELYSPFKTNGLNIGFVVKYDMKGQIKLNPHHDSSAYSLTITLNTADVDFKGGGTRYIKQNIIVRGKKGYAILHPGRLTHYHEGLPITSGTRYIMVSFVN
jgi:GR25 family glycosyltransferase involved in LPS biosynthesis